LYTKNFTRISYTIFEIFFLKAKNGLFLKTQMKVSVTILTIQSIIIAVNKSLNSILYIVNCSFALWSCSLSLSLFSFAVFYYQGNVVLSTNVIGFDTVVFCCDPLALSGTLWILNPPDMSSWATFVPSFLFFLNNLLCLLYLLLHFLAALINHCAFSCQQPLNVLTPESCIPSLSRTLPTTAAPWFQNKIAAAVAVSSHLLP